MKQERHFIVDILFVLALFVVFAISALALVSIGADVYQHTVSDMSDNYDARTGVAYLSEKLRQADALTSEGECAITLSEVCNIPVLELASETEDVALVTRLYYYQGHLKELYTRADAMITVDMLSAGEDILDVSRADFSYASDNLLSISLELSDGSMQALFLAVRSQ